MESEERDESERPPLAHDDTIMFVEEDEDGIRRLVGVNSGNFLAPLEISTQAEALLTMMVDLESVSLGSQVGIIRILGRGPDKQVTVHCEVDESVSREDFSPNPNSVTETIYELQDE